MTERERQKAITATIVAQTWVLKQIREEPGETFEDLAKAVMREFHQHLDISIEDVETWVRTYEAAGLIYHTLNSAEKVVWMYSEPAPLPRSGLRRVVIETPNSRMQAYTDLKPEVHAKALQRDEDGVNSTVIIFTDIKGQPCVVVPAEHIYSLSFDHDEVPTALQ